MSPAARRTASRRTAGKAGGARRTTARKSTSRSASGRSASSRRTTARPSGGNATVRGLNTSLDSLEKRLKTARSKADTSSRRFIKEIEGHVKSARKSIQGLGKQLEKAVPDGRSSSGTTRKSTTSRRTTSSRRTTARGASRSRSSSRSSGRARSTARKR